MKRKLMMAVAFTLIAAMSVNGLMAQEERQNRQLLEFQMSEDNGEALIKLVEDGKKYRIKISGSRILEMQIDGKEVDSADFGKYEDMVKKILAQVEEEKKQAMIHREQAEIHRQEARRKRGELEKQSVEHDFDRREMEKDRQRMREEREHIERDLGRASEGRRLVERERKEVELHRERAREDRRHLDEDREKIWKESKQAEEHREQAKIHRAHAEVERKKAEEERKFYESLLDEIVSAKLASGRSSIKSLLLDEEDFIINGKKQSTELHKQFSQKFLKDRKRISMRSENEEVELRID